VATQLCDLEESSLEIEVRVRKGQIFGSDRWISLKILQEFPDAVFLGVDVESLLVMRGIVARDRSTRSKGP